METLLATGAARRWRGGHYGARLLVVAVTLTAAVLTTTPAEAVEGMEVDAATTYRVDAAGGTIRVQVTAHLTNTLPSQTSGAYINTPYFDYFVVPVVGPVKALRARSSVGGDVSVRVEEERGVTFLLVDLSPNLVYGTPQTITLDFELPGQPPRSKSVTRVNPGFAGWFVAGLGDPGNIDITIDVPKSFQLSASRSIRPKAETRGSRQVYRLTGLKDPAKGLFFASASNDNRLSVQRLEAAGTRVTIKAWPDDPRWQRFAANWVRRGLPVLEDLVGLEPPRDRLTVLESSRTYHVGYAGAYVPELGIVEIGDVLDESVMLHELTHMWFNDDLFTQRWITEGLAEELTNRALPKLGEKARPPKPLRAKGQDAVPLNKWEAPRPLNPTRARIEGNAYNGSYAVVHEITEEIGIEGLRKVLAAAADGRPAYALDNDESGETTVRDWRYFYDLAELVGGSEKVEELFNEHVLDGYERSLLRDRTGARRKLDELTAAGDGWSPPLQLRQAMGAWSFRGTFMFDEAEELLKRAQSVVEDFSAAGIDAESRLQTEYETAASYRALGETLDEYEETAAEVAAVAQRAATAGPIARVGLWGADLSLDQAERAIDEGDLDGAAPLLQQTADEIDAATERGTWILVAAALLCAVIGAHVLRRRATRRRREPVASADGSAVDG